MGTVADKLNKVLSTKDAIKAAIIEKGQTVANTDTFASYTDKIRAIETGSKVKYAFIEDITNVFVFSSSGTLTINFPEFVPSVDSVISMYCTFKPVSVSERYVVCHYMGINDISTNRHVEMLHYNKDFLDVHFFKDVDGSIAKSITIDGVSNEFKTYANATLELDNCIISYTE